MKGFIQEFRTFAMRGNVVDMAVGVVIGAAFGKIVSSLVANLVTPLLGLLLGGVKFDHLTVPLKNNPETGEALLSLQYGIFLQSIFDFLVIAFAIFVALKVLNGMKKKEEAKPAAPAAPPEDIVLLKEIRDLLKTQGKN